MPEKAEMIELYVDRKMTMKEIAKRFSVSATTVGTIVSMYFEKPDKDVVKMSKV